MHVCAQSCQTHCFFMWSSPPGSSGHRIFQARILEWVAISFSRGSSWPRDQTRVSSISYIAGGFFFFTTEPPRKPRTTGTEMNRVCLQGAPSTDGDWEWAQGWFPRRNICWVFIHPTLEEEMTTHSSILTWRTPWTEEPGGLQSMMSQRIGHNWSYLAQRIPPVNRTYWAFQDEKAEKDSAVKKLIISQSTPKK